MGFTPTSGAAAAHTRWSRAIDRAAQTLPAREGQRRSIANQVDPQGLMSPADRAKAERNALQAHMLTMSAKAAKARTAKANARKAAGQK